MMETVSPKRWIRASEIASRDEDGATNLRIPGALEPRGTNDPPRQRGT